ncbi:MAG: hypothetical protein VB025_09250 [Sphaerochaeta sp.]|nr:hypothetical protein [Sphaerochaeta sp.]
MKFSIMGYSQRRLIELNLGMDETMLLRWFVEYQATGKMRSMMIEGKQYSWVNFTGVLDDIPIIGGSVKTMSRRFERLEAAGVMERKTVRQGGVFTYFRICEPVYFTLLDDAAKRQRIRTSDSAEGRTILSNGIDGPNEGGTDLSNGFSEFSDENGPFCGDSPDLEDLTTGNTPENPSDTPETAQKGRTILSNGTDDHREGRTDLSEGGTILSEQMTHTLDTRNIPPIVPQGSKPEKKARKQGVDISMPKSITGELKETLEAFIAARKESGYPLTQRAFSIVLHKLDVLETDSQRIECVNRSIECGYRGVFPENILNRQDRAEPRKKPSQRRIADEAAWETYLANERSATHE